MGCWPLSEVGVGCLGAQNQAELIEPNRLGSERTQKIPRLRLSFYLTVEGFHLHPTQASVFFFFKNGDGISSFINFMLNNT